MIKRLKHIISNEDFMVDENRQDYYPNMFCVISDLVLFVALILHLLLVDAGLMDLIYSRFEKQMLIIAALLYLITALICAIDKQFPQIHRYILLGGMVASGAIMNAVTGENSVAFLLFPMLASGIYYSKKICINTYILLSVVDIWDTLIFCQLDIHVFHYYGIEWDISTIILYYIIPDMVYLTIVFIISMYIIQNGKILMLACSDAARKTKALEMCAEVQLNALPSDTGILAGSEFEISAGIKPAFETAGDFYDFFIISKNKLAVLIADVSDKGLASSMYMMSARNTIRSLFSFTDDIEEIFNRTNNILCDTSDKEFVTMFLLTIDTETGIGKFVNAGHNPPILFSRDGKYKIIETEPQMMLGSFYDVYYTAEEIVLNSGDMLCMYTDGITDTVDKNMIPYGMDGLVAVISENSEKTLTDIKNAVLEDSSKYADETKFSDDKTIVLLKRE